MRKVVLGITGIPGSGKSAAASYVSVKVIDADAIGHALLKLPQIRKKLRSRWGNKILVNRKLSRIAIRKIIVSSKRERMFLNEVMHPPMSKVIKEKIRKHAEGLIVVDAALLFEAEWDTFCDYTVCIVAPLAEIKKRIPKDQQKNWHLWCKA